MKEAAKDGEIVNGYDAYIENKRHEITETLLKESKAQEATNYGIVKRYPFDSFQPIHVNNVWGKKDYKISTLLKTAYALGFEVVLKKRK